MMTLIIVICPRTRDVLPIVSFFVATKDADLAFKNDKIFKKVYGAAMAKAQAHFFEIFRAAVLLQQMSYMPQ